MELLRIFLLSSLILVVFGFTNAQATPSDDLEITSLYKPPNNPPPRLNISYEIIAEWANNGNYDYNATVRLYSDCDQNNLTDESDTITMGAGESDTVTLEITFDETGEVCYSATIYYSSSNYGIFENYIDVEPETDEADLWVDPNSTLNGRNVISGEKVSFEVEYGNRGNVSTLNPVHSLVLV